MRRVSLILASVTVGIASLSYLGAVSVSAMLAYVFVAATIGTVSGLAFGQPNQWLALVAAAVPAVVWAVVVNAVSGEMSGPAARSSAVCGLAAVVAVHGARGARTDQFLAGVVWLVAGAMLYGSAGEVLPIVATTAICVAVTVYFITCSRHQLTTSKWSAAALLFVLASFSILILSVIALARVLPALVNDQQPVISTALREQTVNFSPTWKVASHQLSPNSSTSAAPNNKEPHPPETNNKKFTPQGTENLGRTVLIVVLALFVLVVIAGLVRILWVRSRLARWRRELNALPPRQAIAGSWAWAVTNMRRWRWTIPPDIGVENAVGWVDLQPWPAVLQDEFKNVSRMATAALFARNEPEPQQFEESWALSASLVANGRRRTPRWKRFIALFESVGP